MAQGTLEIVIPGRPAKCSIFLGDHISRQFPVALLNEATSIAIVSDEVVARLYSGQLRQLFSKTKTTHIITIRHGERSKTLATASRIASRMSDLGLDRKSVLIALGGGVVGDLTGFVASIFKRGINYVQIPTTLLAQVDSSIGGKCGVDADWGKNQIGTFYQPICVFIDTSFLDTLPEHEVVNGLAEIVKSSIIANSSMFEKIESRTSDFFSIPELKSLIPSTVGIKSKVVETDEREANVRRILNYGHTIGHAIESSSDYSLSHGKSVVLGMMCEGWIACQSGIFDRKDFARQQSVLSKIRARYKIKTDFESRKVLRFVTLDKKNTAGIVRMSVPERIGKMDTGTDGNFTVSVSREQILQSLNWLRSGGN
jgi:3-dehydroquinate synthase